MEKVYCKDCQYYWAGSMFYLPGCYAPIEDWYSPTHPGYKDAKEMNKNNDCPLFKQKELKEQLEYHDDDGKKWWQFWRE
jgi:hypothetical protein